MIEVRSYRSQLTYETETMQTASASRASRQYHLQCYKFVHLTSLISLVNGSGGGNAEEEALDAFIRHWNDDIVDSDALMRILELTLDLCLEYLGEVAMGTGANGVRYVALHAPELTSRLSLSRDVTTQSIHDLTVAIE